MKLKARKQRSNLCVPDHCKGPGPTLCMWSPDGTLVAQRPHSVTPRVLSLNPTFVQFFSYLPPTETVRVYGGSSQGVLSD